MAKLNHDRQTRAHGEWRAAQRAESLQPGTCAARVRDWLDGAADVFDPELLGATLNGPRAVAALVARVFPTAREVLGDAVIAAATGPDLPECCRWGRAQRHARVHELPAPRYSADLTPLLGRPCYLCVERWRGEARARVEAGQPAPRATVQPTRATARAGVSAVATRPLERFHDTRKCALCEEAVSRNLTASALPTHPRMYALPPDLRRLLDDATGVRHSTSSRRP